VVEGILLCTAAVQMRAHSGWIWTLVSGVASFVLGAMVYVRWPSDSAELLGVFFGINMLFNSSALFALAFSAPKSSPAA